MYNVKFYWGDNKEFTRDINSLEGAWTHDLNRAPTWIIKGSIQVYPQEGAKEPFCENVWVKYMESTRAIIVSAFDSTIAVTREIDASGLVIEHTLEKLYNKVV